MKNFGKIFTLWMILLMGAFDAQALEDQNRVITIGSKTFNESYILAEIISQLLEIKGYRVERKFGLGGTLVCYQALMMGEIDIYAEYSGTLSNVILKIDQGTDLATMQGLLAEKGLRLLPSLGFNNTYAVALKQSLARDLGIGKISDLKNHPGLKMGYSLEFLNREDGWLGLKRIYGLSTVPVGIEHGLAYQAIDEGDIQITDAYSTDGDLERYGLMVLADDRNFFPAYIAMPLVRQDLPLGAQNALRQLTGRFDDHRMRQLNAQVVVGKLTFAQVAAEFLKVEGLGEVAQQDNFLWPNLVKNTLTHLKLTFLALALGCLVGLPLAVVAFRSKTLSRVLIYITGLLQTVPSIALLALMIPLFGIGQLPAIIALFLYSLLPILRNTVTALIAIDPLLKRIAEAMGMTRFQQLRFVLIPLAFPNILAGIKTAAIISIGTATLAAFIGAGGLGEPIVTGLALNDTNLILQGAIPAAGLAILVEIMFEGVEKMVVKKHMLLGHLPA